MVNKIIKIEEIETNDENSITNVAVELEQGIEQNGSVVVEFKGDNSKTSLEKFRDERWEKGGHLVKYNPDFLVDREKFKNEKELGWKYFPLEPILAPEKISSEEIIYISALDYRVGMLCIPAKERLGTIDIPTIKMIGNDKNELAEFYGNYPIFIDSSRDFCLFSGNKKQNQTGVTGYACKCGMKYIISNYSNTIPTSTCPNCKSTIGGSEVSRSLTWTELAYIEVAYRSLRSEIGILKNELAWETEQAEIKENQQQNLLKKAETELAQEKNAHDASKQNHKNQLKELATILFPNNSDINFTDLKEQVQKIIKENQEQAIQIRELELTKSAIRQQIQTKEEKKWETMKLGIEQETDLTRLTNGAYWDAQIQNLHDNLLPANKQSIVLKNRRQQRERQLSKNYLAQIEVAPK